MIFRYSRLNSIFGYGTAGGSICLVSYLISQEVPKLITLATTTTSSTTPTKQVEAKKEETQQNPSTTKSKGSTGGRTVSVKPWWDGIKTFFSSWGGWWRYYSPNIST